MNKTLWVFGDSWAWGWAGEDPNPKQFENRYSLLFANYLKITKIIDESMFGLSFGHITELFLKQTVNMKGGDIVFVTIPPDSRCYITSEDMNTMQSIFFNNEKYKKILEINNYNLYYFSYHLNLFITLISDVCYRLGIDCIIQHNYGKLELFEWCRTHDILDINNSMWDWLGLPNLYDLSQFKSNDGPEFVLKNNKLADKYLLTHGDKYDSHPNELGHQLIFEKIINIYESKKKII